MAMTGTSEREIRALRREIEARDAFLTKKSGGLSRCVERLAASSTPLATHLKVMVRPFKGLTALMASMKKLLEA